MKNLFTKNIRTNSKNQNPNFDFSQNGLSRNQMAALKGGEDIIITDIIGG